MISISSIPSRSDRVVVRRINDECLLIPLTHDIADMDSLYRLNETGAFIWELIDGRRDIKEITAMVAEEFDVDQPEAEKDILLFLVDVQEFLHFSDR
ncbi:MAG: PqqD family protein [Bacteroidales bacterium]|nr:PqqD family protein [Bacteroidales bacterium]